ncbi:MAG TPA: SRPBCC domain-containing protein [Bacteroidia bacterium]|nr:SRPBCC domain-containing protein [Bacteroidia bacterium]
MESKIKVSVIVNANLKKVWDYYTQPEHVTKWNFALDTWHCPYASNDLRVGGRYLARMEAKDGSFGFDFDATYTDVQHLKQLSYVFGDREATIHFNELNNQTEVTIYFVPENENSLELQRDGWQAILNNFKRYTESN